MATEPKPSVVDTFPDGGMRSWIVILGCFFLLLATYGMMKSTGFCSLKWWDQGSYL